jgi:uncharacterized protein (TIGR03435 family)
VGIVGFVGPAAPKRWALSAKAGRVGLPLLLSAALSAQTPDIDKLRFEVASVKPNMSGSQNANIELHPGGRITATNVVLANLMRNVFNLQPYQLVNAPDWIETARFDIEAKADREYSAREDAPAPELLAMLRNLLADRFQLVTHRDMREMPVYALVKAKADGTLGPQIRRSTVDCEGQAARALAARRGGGPADGGAKPIVRCRMSTTAGRIVGTGTTISELMRRLSPPLGRPVVDRTGLSGAFDLELQWSPEQTADTSGPSLFTAVQEQLGLKLESQRAPVEVLVIDKLEKPTPD